MRRRAEQVDETRLRITEAAVRLHTTVGPANTSISRVADEAGVTRLTVYRHFPDLETLFAACTAHWMTLHPAPDPARWLAIEDLEPRARTALTELFTWYREVGDDLTATQRDLTVLPDGARLGIAARQRAMGDALVAGLLPAGPTGTRLRAVAGLVTTLATWRSLTTETGLADDEAVSVAVGLLRSAASTSPG